ncbi:MAG: hypothetical protein HYY26_04720 [Acidobacteria bacterium]|nr:hypothetical protein [Acidobacteriota bacterium]
MRRMVWVLVAFLTLALSVPAFAQGKGQGGGKGKPPEAGKQGERGKSESERGEAKEEKTKKEKEEKAKKEKEEKEREEQAAKGRAFGKDQEKKIRDWFGNQQNLEGLPPGLAKREELPPGLQRHLERNGTLPPGLQKRIQPMPEKLEGQLPKPPEGVKRVVVAGNVVLLEERSSKILDIIKDVRGGSGTGEASTGVRKRDRE